MKKSLRTYLKHTSKDFYNRSVNPPIVRASTIIFKTMKDLRELQKKKLKILEVDIMSMEDKAHLQCMNLKKF